MGRGRVHFTITIKLTKAEKAKELRRISRKNGQPGRGRKTSFVDRKKKAAKERCRTKKEEE